MGIEMAPGTGDALHVRALEIFHQAEYGGGVAVGPAADGEDGAGELAVILADRAMLPEGVAPLMLQPEGGEGLQDLQPLEPALLPVGADHGGIGRHAGDGEEGAAPIHVVGQQAAAHVVDVVGVAVDGRAAGDDGLQRRRLAKRGLQAVEAAPGDADHADGAAAPGLLRQPGDDLAGVVLLLLQILVAQQAVGIAATADVDAGADIALRGHPGLLVVVAQPGAVAAAIGDVFEDSGNRILFGVVGNPQPGREPAPIGHRNPLQFDHADLVVDIAQHRRFGHRGHASLKSS